MPERLSDTSLDVLDAIRNDPRASYRELMERCGLNSTSVVWYHVKKLTAAGLVSQERGARGLYIGERRKGYYRGVHVTNTKKKKVDRAENATSRKKGKDDDAIAARIELIGKREDERRAAHAQSLAGGNIHWTKLSLPAGGCKCG